MHLHPDDLLFFNEVCAAMRRVAKHYQLPLRSINPVAKPELATSALGYCTSTGDITLVMRGMVKGEWCDEPRREEDVWNTAAHELAHLRHFNHGPAFQQFEIELKEAMRNQQVDHRAKVIDKLVKLQASRESEAQLGNTVAAESFAAMINKMLIENELNPSDLDYARANDNDPVIEMAVDLSKYRIDKVMNRVAWQESLARVVAKAHLCSFLIRPGSNWIAFVGTRSHATVAEYAYGVLVYGANEMSHKERNRWVTEQRKAGTYQKGTGGFREAWLTAFVQRIAERFNAIREAAVAQAAPDVPGGTSTALIRLDGQLAKVREYMDDRFAKKRKYVQQLGFGRTHDAGTALGRAAADRMALGRKGVTGGSGSKGSLKS